MLSLYQRQICLCAVAVLGLSAAAGVTDYPACVDQQTNCQQLLLSGVYTCDDDLHHLSLSILEGVTLRTLCCHTCEAPPAPTPQAIDCSSNDPVCDLPVGNQFACTADISPFVRNTPPGTTLASLCPQKCEPECSNNAAGRAAATSCTDRTSDCQALVSTFSCAWAFGIEGHASLHELCPTLCDDSCDAAVVQPLLSARPGSAARTDGGLAACADDMHWGTEHGDCSSYAPGQPNADFCQRDGADQHCLVSCGVCTGGNPTCWQEDFSFERCCGGYHGDPSCFDETFTFDFCCKINYDQPSASATAAPPAAELSAKSNSSHDDKGDADDSSADALATYGIQHPTSDDVVAEPGNAGTPLLGSAVLQLRTAAHADGDDVATSGSNSAVASRVHNETLATFRLVSLLQYAGQPQCVAIVVAAGIALCAVFFVCICRCRQRMDPPETNSIYIGQSKTSEHKDALVGPIASLTDEVYDGHALADNRAEQFVNPSWLPSEVQMETV